MTDINEQLDKAIIEGAECKKEILTTLKFANKSNYQRFQEVMLESSPEIKRILETRKKNRTDVDNEQLKKFKSDIRSMYNQTQQICSKEVVEDGKKSRVEKLVDKIMPLIQMLQYIEENELENEFNRRGIKLEVKNITTDFPGLGSNEKRSIMKDIFKNAATIKDNVNDSNDNINDNIFATLPSDIQYDKHMNMSGMKKGDFRKLVDLKTKQIMATSDEAMDKVDEKIQKAATEKQFEAKRAEIVRDKLTAL